MHPLVSIIVPTKNSSEFLEACLRSIKSQTYPNIELIVVDNFSVDDTQEIARKYADKVFMKGPERSAQRNYGARQSTGEYVLFIDSDMELSSGVVQECVCKMQSDTNVAGVVIPEESFGEGFWAQCKKLERSFYVGVDWMEAARFFRKTMFEKSKEYDETMVSGEDWDLSQRIAKEGNIGRIKTYIYHNEGKLRLLKILQKKYYYAKEFSKYKAKNITEKNITGQTAIIVRYKLFFLKPKKLFADPLVGFGMLFMKTAEFCFGGVGYFFTSK